MFIHSLFYNIFIVLQSFYKSALFKEKEAIKEHLPNICNFIFAHVAHNLQSHWPSTVTLERPRLVFGLRYSHCCCCCCLCLCCCLVVVRNQSWRIAINTQIHTQWQRSGRAAARERATAKRAHKHRECHAASPLAWSQLLLFLFLPPLCLLCFLSWLFVDFACLLLRVCVCVSLTLSRCDAAFQNFYHLYFRSATATTTTTKGSKKQSKLT